MQPSPLIRLTRQGLRCLASHSLGPSEPQAVAHAMGAVHALHSYTRPLVSQSAIVQQPPTFTLTLERGVGKSYGAETELQATGAFAAEVFPDLPLGTTWQTLMKAVAEHLAGDAPLRGPSFTEYSTPPGSRKVLTVAAQLRSMREIQQRCVEGTRSGAGAGTGPGAGPAVQPADALLCVSGSHPLRGLPLVKGLVRSSLDTLRAAEALKEGGQLPQATEMWVVANPNTEKDAELLQRKAALGACCVITQPPLDRPAYARWLEDADRRGIFSQAGMRLVVGHPMVSSAGNARFWLALCGGLSSREALRLVSEAAEAEARGKQAARDHCLALNRSLVDKVRASGLASGMHVMPITQAAKRMTLQLLADGGLPSSRPGAADAAAAALAAKGDAKAPPSGPPAPTAA